MQWIFVVCMFKFLCLRIYSVVCDLVQYNVRLTHCGPVTQICVFTLQLCKTDDANLRF